MGIIFLLICISLFMGILFLIAFFWAVQTGQFDDTTTPSLRVFEAGEEEAPSGLHS